MPCCAAVNCSNRCENGFRVFRFPFDKSRCEKWVHNMRRKNWVPSKSARLCEVHFEHSQFENNRKDGKRKLKSNAIPTLFSMQNPPKKKDPASRKSMCKELLDHTYAKLPLEIPNKVQTFEIDDETILENKNTSGSSENQINKAKHLHLPETAASTPAQNTVPSNTLNSLQQKYLPPRAAVLELLDHTYANLTLEISNEVQPFKIEDETILENVAGSSENQVVDPYVKTYKQLQRENETLRRQVASLQSEAQAHHLIDIKIMQREKRLDHLNKLLGSFLSTDQIKMLKEGRVQNWSNEMIITVLTATLIFCTFMCSVFYLLTVDNITVSENLVQEVRTGIHSCDLWFSDEIMHRSSSIASNLLKM